VHAERLSIKGTLRLTLLLLAWSLVLTASALFGLLRHQDRAAFSRRQAALLTDLAASSLARHLHRDRKTDLTSWIQEVATWPHVTALALTGPEGKPLAIAGPPDVVEALKDKMLSSTLTDTASNLIKKPYPLLLTAKTVNTALGRTTVWLAVDVRDLATSLSSIWGFFVPMTAIGILGVFISILWLSHAVVRPIEALGQRPKPTPTQHIARPPSGARQYREFSRILKTLQDLQSEVILWRDRARELERLLDQRIAEQTRQISRALHQTRRQIWEDPLTGLYNRRMLEDNAAQIFDAQAKAKADLAVVMIDVDHFKNLNDTLGHQAGDELLQFIGQLLRQAMRQEDLAVRYGGDEFLLLLPGVTAKDAEQIALRLINLFKQHTSLLVGVEPRPTLSAGVASLKTTKAKDIDELLRLADEALYRAKKAGKNCVGVCDPSAASQADPPDQPVKASAVAAASL